MDLIPRDMGYFSRYEFARAEENLPEGFAVFAVPEAHRKRLRTSKACESLNGQIMKRTRDVGLFPSEDSLLRVLHAGIGHHRGGGPLSAG